MTRRVLDMYPEANLLRTQLDDQPDGSCKVTKVYDAGGLILRETTVVTSDAHQEKEQHVKDTL